MKVFRYNVVRRLLSLFAAIAVLLLATGSVVSDGRGEPDGQDGNGRTVVHATHIMAFRPENPCGGQQRSLEITYEALFETGLINHTAPEPYWTSLVQTGTFKVLPADSSQPSYSGSFSLYLGGKDQVFTGTRVFEIELVGTGSDGSPFRARLFEHIHMTDNGLEIALATPSFSLTEIHCS